MKITNIIIATILILATIQGATALDMNISGAGDYWLRLTDNLVVTYNRTSDQELLYYTKAGHDKTISVAPYSASDYLYRGQKSANDNFFDKEDIFYVCNQTTPTLCLADYSAGTMQTDDLSAHYIEDDWEIELITRDRYYFSYVVGTNTRNMFLNIPLSQNHSIIDNRTGAIRQSGGTPVYACNDFDTVPAQYRCLSVHDQLSATEHVWYTITATPGPTFGISPSSLYINDTHVDIRYGFDNTSVNSSTVTGINIGSPITGALTHNTTDLIYAFNTNIWTVKKNNVTNLKLNNQITRQGHEFNASVYEPSYNNQYELYVDYNNTMIRHYKDEILTHPQANITLNPAILTHQFRFKILEDHVIIPLDAVGNYRLFKPEFAGTTNTTNTTNQTTTTYYNLTQLTNYTFTEHNRQLTTLTHDLTGYALIGGLFTGTNIIKKINTTSQTQTDSALAQDTPYSISIYGDGLILGTDDEIHAYNQYSTNNLSQIETKGWLFHADRVYDAYATSNETAWVCQNNDEPDYYTIGSEPSLNLGNDCYDINIKNNIMYVDADIQGLRIWNISNTSYPSLINTILVRNTSHDMNYGDLIDIKDDALLIKSGLQTMKLLNISNPYSITNIVTCNNGGAGKIISVEIGDNNQLYAGTNNSRINICASNNTDETTNTAWYSLANMSGEQIIAIEYDNNILHVLGEQNYQTYTVSQATTTTNQPPSIDTITYSSTEVNIGEPIDITITANNTEPEDVIIYGIKCDENETTYTQNTNGLFTCTYNQSGTHTAIAAVTDNFHHPNFYDPTPQTIKVSTTIFTGGILRIQVLDESLQPISNAQVRTQDENKTTPTTGLVTFTTNTTGLYEVRTSKTGYYTDITNYYADGTIHIVNLQLIGETNHTILKITVTNTNGTPTQDALVSYTNTITYDYDYDFTNALGLVIFKHLTPGTNIIQASKEELETTSKTINVAANQTTETTLILQTTTIPELHLDRDCIDEGLWLCGTQDQVENECTTNNDCLSNECQNATGRCTRFNYSACDEIGYPRGQRCVAKLGFDHAMNNITDWMLSNLLWVLIIIILLILTGFVLVSWTAPKK